MPFDQDRHDQVFGAALAARDEYNALLAIVPDSVKQTDQMVLIGHWIDDVETTILSAARGAIDARSAAKWLSLAELALQQVTMMLESVKADINRSAGPGE
jgi:hypothetical protein